jgi:hypothetical protein
MTRRTPAFLRFDAVRFVLGVVLLALAVKACSEPDRQPDSEPTSPQLAAGGGGAASCEAPCLEVEVKVKPGNTPAAGIVVSAIQGGQDGSGEVLIGETDPDGMVSFDLSAFDFGGASELGFCVTARPLVYASDVLDGTRIYPNETPPGESRPYQGAVSQSPNKSVVLSRGNFLQYCVNWTGASQAPVTLDPINAQKVSMVMGGNSASLDITCRLFDGDQNAGNACPTWTIIDLTDNIPWAPPVAPACDPVMDPDCLPEGVRIGLLVSSANQNVAANQGLEFGESYAVETAQTVGCPVYDPADPECRQYTASKALETKPGGKKSSSSVEATADLDPLLCVEYDGTINGELVYPETFPEAVAGIDFASPIIDGFLGQFPLAGAGFDPDPYHVAISYDQAYYGGSGEVTLHMRAKPKEGTSDEFPTTMNKLVKYDFAGCFAEPLAQPVLVSETGPAEIIVEVECRPSLDDPSLTHVVWSITIPGTRVPEYRLDAAGGDTHPEQARSDDVRSMRSIPFPDFCPLDASTIGKTNDPKWWGVG